jgi:hypothetical protein
VSALKLAHYTKSTTISISEADLWSLRHWLHCTGGCEQNALPSTRILTDEIYFPRGSFMLLSLSVL